MVLVDTSVLVDYFARRRNPAVEKFESLMVHDVPFGIPPAVYQELLQGCASEGDFKLLKSYLDTQIIYDVANGPDSYACAARIYRDCRRRGIAVNSAADCLIAQIALERGLFLLHRDNDFVQIQRVVKHLRFY